MSNIIGQIILILILVSLNGFFAMAEIALVTISPSRLKTLSKKRKYGSKIALQLQKNSSDFLSTIQIGVTFSGFLASASSAVALAAPLARYLRELPFPFIRHQSQNLAIFLVTAFISYLSLVFGELVPKQLALRATEKIALLVAFPVKIIGYITYPLVTFLSWSTNTVLKLFPDLKSSQQQQVTEEEIKNIINQQRHLKDKEKTILKRVFDFDDTMVKEIMTPKNGITAISKNTSVKQALKITTDTGYSRLPVIADSIDKIIGIIHILDLATFSLHDEESIKIEQIMKPAYHIPETTKALDLFKSLQKRGTHMAIIVNENGDTAGIITMEDLLEEIVGEIEDEHD